MTRTDKGKLDVQEDDGMFATLLSHEFENK